MAKNSNLHNAKKAKNDEFYTRLSDIENELKNYKQHFENKVVYCNCDQAFDLSEDGKMQWHSNFARYFALNFEHLKLKKLICTAFNENGKGQIFVYDGDKNGNRMPDPNEFEIITLNGNGDFRSQECIDYLKQSDIVVTNPPFSLFREFVEQLMEYGKKFLIIGNNNAITYKEIFPYIKDNKLWLGVSPRSMDFVLPNGEISNVNACWFTNLEHSKRNLPLDLYKTYNPIDYPQYDNYDAIEVSKTADIPMDYDGVMGVPISFLDKYNPNQFEIIGIACGNSWANYAEILKYLNFNPNIKYGGGLGSGVLNGKGVYARILIRHKK